MNKMFVFYVMAIYSVGITLLYIIERKKRKNQWIDKLTGCIRKDYFELLFLQVMEISRRNKQPLSMIYLDANGFKAINDKIGHLTGDKVLEVIGKILRETVNRKTDKVYRLGGDEFGIVLPDATKEGAEKLILKIKQKVERIQEILGIELPISISAGVETIYDWKYPKEFKSEKICEILFKKAEDKMKKDKGENGR